MPDTPDVVPGLRARNAALAAENAVLRAQVAELETETAELAAHVAEQAEKIARLERLPEARAETTQYDRHEVQCSCGECTSRLPRRRRASRERSATG